MRSLSQCWTREARLIATTEEITLHPERPLRSPLPRRGSFGIAAIVRGCQSFFDWHPLIGGLVALALTAIAVTATFAMLEAVIPLAGRWALCTPLNGAVLAVLLMSRRKLWPFLLVGYVTALSRGTVLAGATYHPGSIEIAGNVAELLLAAFTLPPYRNLKQWLQEPRLLRAFSGYALLLGPLVMALTVARQSAGTVGAFADLPGGFWERTRTIGLSESIGVALGTSLVLVLCNRQTYLLFRWRTLPRTFGMLTLLVLAALLGFSRATSPALFLPYAVLVAMAFLLGVRGAVLGTATASVILCALAAHGRLAAAASISGQGAQAQTCIALAVLAVFPLSLTLFRRNEIEQRVKEYQAELDKLKSLDRLTGIANRKRFDLVLAREWQRASRDRKPIALLIVDADFFEMYNAHYGTAAGDECLRQIANRLANQPHRHYDLVSRFEGGRFSVLLPGASGDAVERIGEEVRAEIAELEWPHERSQFGRVTVSVGYATMLPNADLKSELLIAAADAALAVAKRKGKNRVEGFASNVVEMTAIH